MQELASVVAGKPAVTSEETSSWVGMPLEPRCEIVAELAPIDADGLGGVGEEPLAGNPAAVNATAVNATEQL